MWDSFVKSSRNGTFLFERAYMDYHSDRFCDYSLMYFNDKNKLIALLPGNAISSSSSATFSSHSGLTYGGFVLSPHTRAVEILELFEITKQYLKSEGFGAWEYKSVPSIYHRMPSEEDEYALWLNNAELKVCNLSTTIDLRSSFSEYSDPEKSRRQHKALLEGFEIKETEDFSEFWQIVEDLLAKKYNVKPVHTLEEISLLHSRFPSKIRCFVASLNNKVEAGIVVYETDTVAHAQYTEATDFGLSKGAVVLLYKYLIEYYHSQRFGIRYFDFGISNEDKGRYLNHSLISFKEDFAGRGVTYKTYQITL